MVGYDQCRSSKDPAEDSSSELLQIRRCLQLQRPSSPIHLAIGTVATFHGQTAERPIPWLPDTSEASL